MNVLPAAEARTPALSKSVVDSESVKKSRLRISDLHHEAIKALGNGVAQNSNRFSAHQGGVSAYDVNWPVLFDALDRRYGLAPQVKQEDDELEEDTFPPNRSTVEDSAMENSQDRTLLHTRVLMTTVLLEMKKMKSGYRTNGWGMLKEPTMTVVSKLQELEAEHDAIELSGEYKLNARYTKPPIHRMDGRSAFGEIQLKGPDGWLELLSLQDQPLTESEFEEASLYDLVPDTRYFHRPSDAWFASLVSLRRGTGCPLDTEVDVKVSLIKGEDDDSLKHGQLTGWFVVLQSTVRIYGSIERLVSLQGQRTPLASEQIRRLLHVFLPSPNVPAEYSSEWLEYKATMAEGKVTLKEFYGILSPAPITAASVDALVQPPGMVAQLKPFQRRTVAWVLRNENATSIHPSFAKLPYDDPSGLWEKVRYGGENGFDIAFCRLTGRVQRITDEMHLEQRRRDKGKGKQQAIQMGPEKGRAQGDWILPRKGLIGLESLRGSMLCEEMGLGKTLEAIAVVMLHPRINTQIVSATLREDNDVKPTLFELESVEIVHAEGSQAHAGKRRRLDDGEVIAIDTSSSVQPFRGSTHWDDHLKVNITEVKSTLIVTPRMLLRQWVDELKKHAPTLKFIVYTGYATMHRDWIARVSENQTVDDSNQNARKKRKRADDDTTESTYAVEETVERIRPHKGESDASFFRRWYASWLEKFGQVDVVFVTYETLAKDLDVALAPKERPRRAASGPPREKPRSVLVMCQYWRVIMDEVQTLDAQSASRGAQMVTSLHRVNSLVLSGTPAKRSVSDLLSSLTFIGVELRPAIWTRFLKPGFREAFQSLFEEVAVRHTKESVKHEANIPPQIRQIIPIKMNVIELQYYRDLLYRNIDSLVAVSGYRDEERLRGLVQTLRAVCTHIQTNDGPRRNDDNRVERMRLVRDNGRVLKDMDEALMKMQLQAWRDYFHYVYELESGKIKFATQLHSSQPDQYARSLQLLQRVARECEREIAHLQEKVAILKDSVDIASDDLKSGNDDDDDDDEGSEVDDAGSINRKESGLLRVRMRDINILMHEALFRCGDFYHQHQDQDGFSALEVEYYAKADQVRQVLLSDPLRYSNSSIERVRSLINRGRVRNFEMLEVAECDHLGIQTDKYVNAINEFLDGALNANAEYMWNLRAKVVTALLEEVNWKQGEDAAGDEFDKTLLAQATLETYFNAYTDALSDRREMITDITTSFQEVREKSNKKRNTRTAQAIAVDLPEDENDTELQNKLRMDRKEYRSVYIGHCSLQGLITELDDFIGMDTGRREEIALARGEQARLKKLKDEQLTLLKSMEDEAKSLNQCFNTRLTFFTTLQQISDGLIDADTAATEEEAVLALSDAKRAERVKAARIKERDEFLANGSAIFVERERRIATALAHARYLDSLSSEKKEEGDTEECMICQQQFSEISDGIVFLQCAHRLCQPCYSEYLKTAARPTCPCCRLLIAPSQVQKVDASKKKEPVMASDPSEKADALESDIVSDRLALAQLNVLPRERQEEINHIEIEGQWGAKLDFLIRHLKYWKRIHPNVKHIVFSAWKSSLGIVQTAFRANRISWKTITTEKNESAVREFCTNDDQVFLLHGERQVSGLTLTVATVVHLLEPVMNQGYELQAIGRVDRLGQEKETCVFCYACEETVEAKIINRALRKGQCIYAKTVENIAFDADTSTMQVRKGADKYSGDRDDLLDLLL